MLKRDLDHYLSLPYTITLKRNDDQGTYWVARVVELPHCMTHGVTPEEALVDIEDAKKEWIKSNFEDGLPIPEPNKYSGQYHLRMPPSLHEALSLRSESEDVSLNQYIITALARAVGYAEPEKQYAKRKQELLTVKEPKRKYQHR